MGKSNNERLNVLIWQETTAAAGARFWSAALVESWPGGAGAGGDNIVAEHQQRQQPGGIQAVAKEIQELETGGLSAGRGSGALHPHQRFEQYQGPANSSHFATNPR